MLFHALHIKHVVVLAITLIVSSWTFLIKHEHIDIHKATQENIPFFARKALNKLSDSLTVEKRLFITGDFNGDRLSDFSAILRNQNNNELGIIIIHRSSNQPIIFDLGSNKKLDTDLKWVEVIEMLPKGSEVVPMLIDLKTNDIIGPDQSKAFTLTSDAIYLTVREGHGGIVMYWGESGYKFISLE